MEYLYNLSRKLSPLTFVNLKRRDAALPVLVPRLGTFLPSGLESVLVTEGAILKRRDWSPRQDLDARQPKPHERLRTCRLGRNEFEAMKKADGLRHAADTCNYLFSSELKRLD
jgi:hypothetical protein